MNMVLIVIMIPVLPLMNHFGKEKHLDVKKVLL